jgi:hypothetical protein
MSVDYTCNNYKRLSKGIYGHFEGPSCRKGFFPDLKETFCDHFETWIYFQRNFLGVSCHPTAK